MRVAYLTPSVSRAAGGIFEVERRLAQSVGALPGTEVEAFAPTDEYTDVDITAWEPIHVRTFPSYGPRSFSWSPQLSRAFASSTADVAHLHVLWMYTSLVMRRWSRRSAKPYMTTLHGMLDAWALQHSRWKKRLSAISYERDCLRRASCIQAFSEAELASARTFGLRNPICIIPNGIDLPDNSPLPPPWNGAVDEDERILLYLGRLHPKKGLVNLIRAWKKICESLRAGHPRWRLIIAGWSQLGHEAALKELARACGIESQVYFAGPLYGDAKVGAYQHADAVVLPSYSEGLPMAVLEAWAYKKPVLMTAQCNLPEGFAVGAAILAQPEEESLVRGLAEIMEAADEERRKIGHHGWELVNRRFTWPKVAQEMLSVYGWLVGGGPAPECVVKN